MREMRNKQRLMSRAEAEKYLSEETWGVLSVFGDDGYPYGVPMNYAWTEGAVLLHATSQNSHRLDALKRNARVCFTVVPVHRIDRANWSTIYASVVLFGTAEILTDAEEKRAAMRAFMQKLSPEKAEEAMLACDPARADLVMLRIGPNMITGKKNG